jgi:formamidopyrimidine-DNA glycosylase
MPELPDVDVYVDRLGALCKGQKLTGIRLKSPFLLRSVDPPLTEVFDKRVKGFSRIGKRIVTELEGGLFLVVHLMIAGRLRKADIGVPLKTKVQLAAFDFERFSIVLTEAGSKKRASLYAVRGRSNLKVFDRGGLEPLTATQDEFRRALARENRTLKRALTDPSILSGIGNAYSDEMLHRARLSPVKRTAQLSDEECKRLFDACRETLETWRDRLKEEVGEGFPDKVTAFRDGMAVHGRYKQPCPVCNTPVQRIRYAANEVNYCPTCQTEGRLLADRALSRLLKKDWPRSLDELDERLGR